MKNINVLSTDKPSRLLYDKEEFCYLPLQDKPVFMDCQHLVENRHIYITSSDEEIKEGDWYIDDSNMVRKSIISDKEYWSTRQDYKKVILTTNDLLIKDGIQSIDDEFLRWFVNNSSCEWVEIVRGFADGTNWGYNFLDYKIIISK